MHVHVVVHAVPAGVAAHFRAGQRAGGAVVVVAQYQGYAVQFRIADQARRFLAAVKELFGF